MSPAFDLAVVGAGSTGAAVALWAARAGMKVALVERGPIEESGARWVNDVPHWMIAKVGLASHLPEMELAGHDSHGALLLTAGASAVTGAAPQMRALRVPGAHWSALDMRAMAAVLVREAREAGVVLRPHLYVREVSASGALETSEGPLEARVLVDASGLAGPSLLRMGRVDRRDLCAAAQEVRELADPERAHRFMQALGAAPGDTVAMTGVCGGYSVLNLRILHATKDAPERLGILAGSIPGDGGHASGAQMIARFVEANPWIGAHVFGGSRAIPLAPPFEPFASERVVHVGDAARQVFPAHGSGVGSGLIAARMLVDALSRGESPRAYVARWMREVGPLHVTYDLFRRFSHTLTAHELTQMIEHGLLSQGPSLCAVEQRMPALAPGELIERIAAIPRTPGLAARAARWLGRAPLAGAIAKAMPEDARGMARTFAALRRVADVRSS